MKIQEIPEKYKKYVKGYVKEMEVETIRPYFAKDKEGDHLVYGDGFVNKYEIQHCDRLYLNDEIKELIEIVPELPVYWILEDEREYVIDKETFESDLYQAVYNK